MRKRFMLLSLCLTLGSVFTVRAAPWEASWIRAKDASSERANSWYVFRKSVTLESVESKLMARISADTKYWLYINGVLAVSEGGLKRTASPTGSYYDEVDIAPFLVKGKNTIALLLWHFGKTGFSHNDSGLPALLFEAKGNKTKILSDAQWTASRYSAYKSSGGMQPNYRLSEGNVYFDAREEMDGWQRADFRKNLPAVEVVSDGFAKMGELYPRTIPFWRDYGLKKYASVVKSGTQLVCTLPYNCQITPYIKLTSSAGKQVEIRSDNYNNTGANSTSVRAVYVTREGRQQYESLGWMNGHKIIYTIPSSVEVEDVMFRESGYDTDFSGSFSCDDNMLNELWNRASRTLYVTMRDNYMDCPERERAQWWGDEVIELEEAVYALSPSSQRLAAKGIDELMRWQQKDGTIFAPMPYGGMVRSLPVQMLSSVGWYGFYSYYRYTGDSSFVARHYDGINRYLHSVWTVQRSGLCGARPGPASWARDWCDWGLNIDKDAITNFWYILALKAQREFAIQLGKERDAEMCTQTIEKMKDAINRLYWNGTAYRSTGYYGATDDRAQALAVLSGVADESKYPYIIKVLEKEEHASPYMEKYVAEALFKMNNGSMALSRIKRRYKKMLGYNLTTLMEFWDYSMPGADTGTSNHAWSGGPLTLMSRYVCGISPLSPGFKTFVITPQMGYLKQANAVVETNYGFIKANIKTDNGKWEMRITVPYETTAQVVMPDGYNKTFGAGEHFISSLTGVEGALQESVKHRVIVENGHAKLSDYEGELRVFSISGVEIPSSNRLAPGYYVLKAGKETYKFQVR